MAAAQAGSSSARMVIAGSLTSLRWVGVQDRGQGRRDLDHVEYVPKLRAGPGICAGQSDFRTGLENRYGA
jgi:hypothetical protein